MVFDILKEYWPLFCFGGTIVIWLLRLDWRVREVGKSRAACELRCENRVDVLKSEYNDDIKELKADLKETMRITQEMNISVVSLSSFLQGKGVTSSNQSPNGRP